MEENGRWVLTPQMNLNFIWWELDKRIKTDLKMKSFKKISFAAVYANSVVQD